MAIFQLLLKIAGDIRTRNGQAIADIIQLIQLISGFNPVPPTPNPAPPIAPGAFKTEGVASQNVDAVADKIEAFVKEHQDKGPGVHANGVFLKALWQLVMEVLPLIISGLK